MASSSWKRTELTTFIILYQECENLYNFNHPDYHNKKKRLDSLTYICKKLEKQNKSVTINEIKQKIKTLRNQYAAVKKAETMKQNGTNDINDPYIPKLWCYDQLHFLDDYIQGQHMRDGSVSSVSPTPSSSHDSFRRVAADTSTIMTDEQLMDILEETNAPIVTETILVGKPSLNNSNSNTTVTVAGNSNIKIPNTNNINPKTTSTATSSSSASSALNIKRNNTQYPNINNNKQSIDHTLAEFIYSNNIPFDIIESPRFRKFIQSLDKTYIIPKKKQLLTTILDDTFDSCQYENDGEEKDAILMLSGLNQRKENMKFVIACIQLDDESRNFLNLWDIEMEENTLEFINEILVECQQLAKSIYNAKFYMILSDDPELEIQPPIWHAVCNAPIVECFTYEILDLDVVAKIVKILRIIEKLAKEDIFKPNCPIILPVERNWSTFRDTFRSYLKNFEDVRLLIEQNSELFDNELTDLIFNEQFLKQVQRNFKLLISLTDLITVSQKGQSTLAELANSWLTLTLSSEFNEQLEKYRNNALNIYALAANYLHPKYKGRQLSFTQTEMVKEFLEEILDNSGRLDLIAFREGKSVFKLLAERNVTSAKTFWSMAEKRHPELKKVAKKLLMNPASTFELDKWFSKFVAVHGDIRNTLGLERFRKLGKIYFTFKFQDQNVKTFDLRDLP